LWAAWIADFGSQPLLRMVEQRQGALSGVIGPGFTRVVATQQLNQGSGQLLGGSTGTLAFQGMPVAVTDAQLAVQSYRHG
jgi:hypothetical protein